MVATLAIPLIPPACGLSREGYHTTRATLVAAVTAVVCLALSQSDPRSVAWMADDGLEPALAPILLRLDAFACLGWTIALLAMRRAKGPLMTDGLTGLSLADDVTAWVAVSTAVLMFAMAGMLTTRIVTSMLT